jgi:hypothetical protein
MVRQTSHPSRPSDTPSVLLPSTRPVLTSSSILNQPSSSPYPFPITSSSHKATRHPRLPKSTRPEQLVSSSASPSSLSFPRPSDRLTPSRGSTQKAMQRKEALRGKRLATPPSSQGQELAREDETDEEVDVEDGDQVWHDESSEKVSRII